MPSALRHLILAALFGLAQPASRTGRHHRTARAAPRPAAILSRRQDERRPAKGKAEHLHRAVSQERFFHRPSRRAAAIPRAQPRVLSGRRTHGRRRNRMRRDIHEGPPVGLPAFAMRPAHDHQYPLGAGAGEQMHAALQPRRSRHRQEGIGEMLHQRHHAGGVQDADGEDGRRQHRLPRPSRIIRTARRAGAPTSMPARAR